MTGENTLIYFEHGGSKQVVLPGATISIRNGDIWPIHAISETIAIGDITATSASIGTASFTTQIPKGAIFVHSKVDVTSAFSGDTTAGITIGDGTDVDRYNTGSINVFAATSFGVNGHPSGERGHAAASTPVVTLTVASTVSGVSASASLTATLYYIATL